MKLIVFLLVSMVWVLRVAGQDLDDRYMIGFYGIPIPETGANVLIVADRSGSMQSQDMSRKYAGTRWDTLVDEVSQMVEQMTQVQSQNKVPFSVVLLYEGNGDHVGTKCFNVSKPKDREKLIEDLKSQSAGGGPNFEKTFGVNLWPLVSKHYLTHVFFLGDTDIESSSKEVIKAVEAWYQVGQETNNSTASLRTKSVKKTKEEKQLIKLKNRWLQKHKSSQAQRNRTRFLLRGKGKSMPEELSDVVFNCITIGKYPSQTQKQLVEIGSGICVNASQRPVADEDEE